MAATPNALMEANEEQADTVDVLDVNTSSNRTTAPDVLFCKGSPPMKKVIMTVQPDLLQSASKRREASASVAPRVLTKKKKMITR